MAAREGMLLPGPAAAELLRRRLSRSSCRAEAGVGMVRQALPVSPCRGETISRIIDKTIEEMNDWANRPLNGAFTPRPEAPLTSTPCYLPARSPPSPRAWTSINCSFSAGPPPTSRTYALNYPGRTFPTLRCAIAGSNQRHRWPPNTRFNPPPLMARRIPAVANADASRTVRRCTGCLSANSRRSRTTSAPPRRSSSSSPESPKVTWDRCDETVISGADEPNDR